MDEVIRVRKNSPEFNLVRRVNFLRAAGEDYAFAFEDVDKDLLSKIGYKFETCTLPIWNYTKQVDELAEVTKVTW